MPFVFAIQNPQVAAALNPEFSLQIVKLGSTDSVGTSVTLRTPNAKVLQQRPVLRLLGHQPL
jgi:hypothetical protein